MSDLIIEYKLLASAILLAVTFTLKWLTVRHFKKLPENENEHPRRWINAANNTATALFLIGLILIWISEIRFAALSIATFMVALIIATREFIQCFLGSLYQTSSRIFIVGDWIKVNNHYGEVAKSDWLTTHLLEIDIESSSYSYTGRTIVIPNNQFLSNNIQNLNYMRRYVTHTFSIVRDDDQLDIKASKEFITRKAIECCEPF